MGFKGTLGKMMLGKNAQPPAPSAPAVPVTPVIPAPVAWDASRFRIQLKLAKSRIEIQHGKKANEISATRQTIANHLRANKETLARIHAERVLRESTQIQAFDVVRTFIEMLTNSHNVFSVQRDFATAGSDIKESVSSVVFASTRLNIPELHTICDMFRAHFGAAVIDPITRLDGPYVSCINKTLARTLDTGAPDGYLILQELTKIAADFGISWVPPPEFNDLDGRGPGDTSYYRPVPLHHPVMGGPPMPPGPSAPPPPDDFGGYAPTNIPGHNPYPGPVPYGDAPPMPPQFPSGMPPAPPSAPPFDPSGSAPGTLYPSAPPSSGPDPYGGQGLPPPPPPANFFSDDELEARFRNVRDGK